MATILERGSRRGGINPIFQPNFCPNISPRKVTKFSFKIKHLVVLFIEVVAFLVSLAVSQCFAHAQL